MSAPSTGKLSRWLKHHTNRVLARLPGGISAGLRHPMPGSAPWQRKNLTLWSRGGGLGDELMCTAVFRAVLARNPECRICFHSRHEAVFRDHPGIAELMPYTGPVPGAVELRYDWVVPPKRALAEHMGECVGLSGINTGIWLPSWDATPALLERLKDLPRPWAVLQPKASAWTPNKQWPIERWQELAKRLAKKMTVFEVGAGGSAVLGDAAVDLTGATDTRDFAALVGMADVFAGPPSGGMHLANARQTPSVIVFGGYERASGYVYSNVMGIEGSVPCAPCWLTTSCTVGLGCLTGISVDAVEAAVLKQVATKGTHATGIHPQG